MSTDILIVDDDLDMRMTLVELLAEEGYSVDSLASASTLVQNICERGVRLVLLDLTMPGFDVAHTAREMRESGLLPDVRVVVLSGLERTREIAAQLGFFGALPKPFEIDALFSTVESALGARSANTLPPSPAP